MSRSERVTEQWSQGGSGEIQFQRSWQDPEALRSDAETRGDGLDLSRQ